MAAITSGNISEPPLMVSVAVQLMNGRTPMRVYTSGLGSGGAGGVWPAASPAATAPLV